MGSEISQTQCLGFCVTRGERKVEFLTKSRSHSKPALQEPSMRTKDRIESQNKKLVRRLVSDCVNEELRFTKESFIVVRDVEPPFSIAA